jgi:hypothetical protein
MTNNERPAGTEDENELKPNAPTSRQTIANTLVGCSLSVSPEASYEWRDDTGDKSTEVPRITKRQYNEDGKQIGFVMLVDEGVLPITGKQLWDGLRQKEQEQV